MAWALAGPETGAITVWSGHRVPAAPPAAVDQRHPVGCPVSLPAGSPAGCPTVPRVSPCSRSGSVVYQAFGREKSVNSPGASNKREDEVVRPPPCCSLFVYDFRCTIHPCFGGLNSCADNLAQANWENHDVTRCQSDTLTLAPHSSTDKNLTIRRGSSSSTPATV